LRRAGSSSRSSPRRFSCSPTTRDAAGRWLQGADPDGPRTTSRRAENEQANAQGLRQAARRRHAFWSDTTLLDADPGAFQRHSGSYGIKASNPRHSLHPPGLRHETDHGMDAPPRADQRVGIERDHIEFIEVEPLKRTLPNAVPAAPSRSAETRSRETKTGLVSRRPRTAACNLDLQPLAGIRSRTVV
jgi:hypothetical protein